MKLELKDSGIIFNEEEHTYYNPNTDTYLSGITDMLSRQLFPKEYENVPQYILDAAAAYGSSVHKTLEKFDTDWLYDESSQELSDYIQMCSDYNLTHEKSEYTVTDGSHWASNIDKVYRDSDNSFSIADIKTYYGKMSPEKLCKTQWQLSIYSYLWNLQNPDAKINHLYVIHVRNKTSKSGKTDHQKEFIELTPIPGEICKELLDCDLRGVPFQNPYAFTN